MATIARSGTNRLQDLHDALANFEAKHIEWVEADNRPDPDSTYWDAVELLIDTFDEGDMPSSMRPMSELVQRLSAELTAFDQRDDQEDQMPEESFFAIVEAILQMREKEVVSLEPLYIEPIKDLIEQKVTREQIARMYGFVDRQGRPETWKVQEELDKPGTHVNENWVHPAERKHRQRIEESRHRREDAVLNGAARKMKKTRLPCPETCRELWGQGVTAAQAAKMLDRPPREIEQEYRDFEDERADLAKAADATAKERRIRELTGGRGRRGRVQGEGNAEEPQTEEHHEADSEDSGGRAGDK